MFWTGVTTNKNTLGMLCMIVGLGSLWRFLREWGKGKTRRFGPLMAHGVILAASIYLLREADSATSTSCFLLCGGLIAVIQLFRMARTPVIVHLLSAAVVGLAVCAVFFVGSLLEAMGRNSTLTGRTDLWSEVMSIPVNRIVGTGYESFWLGDRLATMWRLSGQVPVQAHNGYIEILVNLGVVGVFLLATIIFTGYFKIMQGIRRDPQTECLRLAFFLAALIYNMTEAAFKMSVPLWLFFVWANMAAVPKAKSMAQPLSAEPAPERAEWFAEAYTRRTSLSA
jgi:O-antigen ligase